MKRVICSTIDKTEIISEDEKNAILRIFQKYDISILNTFKNMDEEDGILYNEIVVSIDRITTDKSIDLLTGLKILDISYGIDYYTEIDSKQKIENFHFYHYLME